MDVDKFRDQWTQITVTTFKESGKLYSDHNCVVETEHVKLAGNDLQLLIVRNDATVRQYSGLSSGFNGEFYYFIHVEYPKHVTNFCTFMLKPYTRRVLR